MKIDVEKIGYIDEVDEYRAVVFLDADGTRYFQIQDAYEYDDQDKDSRMNTYYLEKNEQMNGSYGGISTIKLSKKLLEIHLDENCRSKLKGDKIELGLKGIDFDKLEKEIVKFAEKHGILLIL